MDLKKLKLIAVCVVMIFGSTVVNGAKPLRVLLVLGGHGFQKEQFDVMLKSIQGVEFEKVYHPDSYLKFTPDQINNYDVVMQYDMNKNMPAQAREDYMQMISGGKGLVVVHHSYCGNEDFPEYKKIIGGQYYHTEWKDEQGVTHPKPTYEHDVHVSATVVDRRHPVTKGVVDFQIIDELYRGGYIASDVKPLVASDDSGCPLVCWTKNYGKGRVVTLLLGHDNQAWVNPSFTTLLRNALFYVK